MRLIADIVLLCDWFYRFINSGVSEVTGGKRYGLFVKKKRVYGEEDDFAQWVIRFFVSFLSEAYLD
jgi:hypothetical protein